MPLISQPESVNALYQQAMDSGVCLANFCTANTYTTEAILKAVYEFGQAHDLPDLPVIISATARYAVEPQLIDYTHLNHAPLGMQALLDDVDLMLGPESPYRELQVMLHFDHGQPDVDADLFDFAADKYATIMFDASGHSLAQNIEITRDFVERMRDRVLVEGAVTEIAQAEEHADIPLTTADEAQHFFDETGVFLIVPDLGTEHRSTAAVARYSSERAREIKDRVGQRMVLHGSSSLQEEHLRTLVEDGIVKVNIWTIFEKLGGQAVARYVVNNLAGILPPEEVRTLHGAGVLGDQFAALESDGPQLNVFRQSAYRAVWQDAVVEKMKFYLDCFHYANFARNSARVDS